MNSRLRVQSLLGIFQGVVVKRVVSVVMLSICAVAFARDFDNDRMSNPDLLSCDANAMKVMFHDYPYPIPQGEIL